MNTYEMFAELEEFFMNEPKQASHLVKEAYNRVDEFGDYYRSYFILMRRYKRTKGLL